MIKRCLNPFVGLVILLMLMVVSFAPASVVLGPTFFVKVEVLDLGVETISRPDGSSYSQNFIEFKIVDCVSGSLHKMAIGDTFRTKLFRSNMGLFKKGDHLVVGVEIGSSMGRSGPVEFVLWSPIQNTSGKKILESFNFPAD